MLTGEIFVQEGVITREQLQVAEEKHKEMGGSDPIARVLVNMGFVQERDRVRCLGKVWGIPYCELAQMSPAKEVLDLLSPQLAKRFKAIPIEEKEGRLHVAMANPLDVFIVDELRLATGFEIEALIAVEEDIVNALQNYYRVEQNVNDALAGMIKDFSSDIDIQEATEDELSEAELREMGEDAPIVRLANLIISQGI